MGVCILTGWIVWVAGPWKAGEQDGAAFISKLDTKLPPGKVVKVDAGYNSCKRFMNPCIGFDSKDREQKLVARAQHECVNSRLKIFNVLTMYFRHTDCDDQTMMDKHRICFNAVAVLTQLKIADGESIFANGLEYDCSYF